MKMKRIDTFLILAALVIWLWPSTVAQASSLPDEAYVSGVVGYAQSYSLSCEARSAVDWAAFWGVEISEEEFLERLPRSDNPNKGFVGDPSDEWGWSPPHSYGVYADPVAQLLRQYGLEAHAGTRLSWDEARAEIAAGRPVIVWVIGSIWAGTPKQYTASDGETVVVAANEHTMILTGYDQDTVQLVDAFTGQYVSYSLDIFLASWETLRRMAIIGGGVKEKDVEIAFSEPVVQNLYTVQSGDTLVSIAAEKGLTWTEIAATNQIDYPYSIRPGDVLNLPAAEGDPQTTAADSAEPPDTYTASDYESLFALAHRFDVSWIRLALVNRIAFPFMLAPGQSIQLP
jgi:uncharacterized protein YvpB/LysM repeat protein